MLREMAEVGVAQNIFRHFDRYFAHFAHASMHTIFETGIQDQCAKQLRYIVNFGA